MLGLHAYPMLCVRESITSSHMIEFVLLGMETGLDISQTFAISKLGEGHAQVLVEAGKLLDLEVAVITIDTLMKDVER